MNKECNLLGAGENVHTFQFLLPNEYLSGIFVQHRADHHGVTMEKEQKKGQSPRRSLASM